MPHAAIATVSEDGSPLNTPVFGTFNDNLHFFWSSSPEAQHSRNIGRDQFAFVVIFDSVEGHGGLYIAGRGEQLDDLAHLDYAYNLLKTAKQRSGGTMGDLEYYQGNGPQRLYRIVPEKVWVNKSTKNEDGAVIRDERLEVTAADILPE